MSVKTGVFLAATLFSHAALSDATIAQRHVEDASLIGEARMKVMFWNVFDASLYAGNGEFDRSEPFSLSLAYLRDLKGEKIVSKTIEQMARQKRFEKQELSGWSAQLSTIIDDVDSSTTITGVRDDQGHTIFYRNGEQTGKIANARFTEGFFDIWLGENTSEPRLRKQLLSAGKS